MVVEHEDSLCANGDNYRVLQGVVDNLGHLMMVMTMMVMMVMVMVMLVMTIMMMMMVVMMATVLTWSSMLLSVQRTSPEAEYFRTNPRLLAMNPVTYLTV